MPDVVKWSSGGTPKATEKSYYENGTIPWLIIGDLNDGVVTTSASKITELGLQNSSAKMIPVGTLLVAMYGSIGKLGITGIECCTNQAIAYAKELKGVSTKYMYYYMAMMKSELISQGKGGTQKNISQTVLNSLEVLVPPEKEQKRIVNKIEELFSELDGAVETLKKTKEQLAVYRQSVLSTAIGQSEECCQMHIEELLVKNRKGMTTGPFGTMIKKSDHRTSGHPMLGIENIGRGKFCDGNKIFVTDEKAKELEKYRVKRGDVIISRSGTVGEICEIPQRAENALISTNLIRISLDENVVLSQYFIYLFQTQGSVLKQVKELCKGSTRPFLTQGILKDIIFPIPTIKKQRQIISQIESQLTLSENIEKTINDALIQAEAMRQSILKKAFEGEL